MKKVFLVSIVYFLCTYASMAQYFAKDSVQKYAKTIPNEDGNKIWNRLRFGGGLSGGVGSFTYINVSPTIAYLVNEKYILGTTFDFIYYKYSNRTVFIGTNSGVIYGISPFNRYFITKDVFLQVEVLFQNLPISATERVWNTYPMAGGGYSIPLSNRASLFALVMYNFNNTNPYSFYGPLVLRIGFTL